MNHPPQYPRRLRTDDSRAADLVAGLIVFLSACALCWMIAAAGCAS